MDCSFIGWCALGKEAQAAWAQAILSALAIVAAAYIPRWHERMDLGRRMDNYVTLVVYTLDTASIDVQWWQARVGTQRPKFDLATWDRLLAAYDAVPYYDLPHYSLFHPIQMASNSARNFRASLEAMVVSGVFSATLPQGEVDRLKALEKEFADAYALAAQARNEHGGRTPLQILRSRLFQLSIWLEDELAERFPGWRDKRRKRRLERAKARHRQPSP